MLLLGKLYFPSVYFILPICFFSPHCLWLVFYTFNFSFSYPNFMTCYTHFDCIFADVCVCTCLCSGCMQDLRWISGAVAWSCTLCCAGRCPSMMTTCQRSSRRSVMASSLLHSTWTLPLSAFSNTCCRLIPWREPQSKRSGEILFFVHRPTCV